jgi:hypothetical protein
VWSHWTACRGSLAYSTRLITAEKEPTRTRLHMRATVHTDIHTDTYTPPTYMQLWPQEYTWLIHSPGLLRRVACMVVVPVLTAATVRVRHHVTPPTDEGIDEGILQCRGTGDDSLYRSSRSGPGLWPRQSS